MKSNLAPIFLFLFSAQAFAASQGELEAAARKDGALNLFTNFSLLPLQLVSLLGFAASASGLLAGAYYLVQYFRHSISVPGNRSRSMMRFTARAATILRGTPVLWPSPCPGAPAMIGAA